MSCLYRSKYIEVSLTMRSLSNGQVRMDLAGNAPVQEALTYLLRGGEKVQLAAFDEA